MESRLPWTEGCLEIEFVSVLVLLLVLAASEPASLPYVCVVLRVPGSVHFILEGLDLLPGLQPRRQSQDRRP